MPEITEPYLPGTPCWVDLMADDQRAAIDFYGELFGWSGELGPEEFKGYAVMEKDGRAVCGIGPKMSPEGAPEPPHVWTTYLATEDSDESLRRARSAGGTVLVESMDVGNRGRMAVLADSVGAIFGLWQAGEFAGAALVNEPGSLLWNSCETRDPKTAGEFYEQVFGLESRRIPGSEGALALVPSGTDRPVGSIDDLGEHAPHVPPFWMTTFACDDVEALVTAASRRGGEVLGPPEDTPYGRAAGLHDPWGGMFGVMQVAEG
ncbi:VOC family protein [Streptomyces sp. NA04227]|uniref:VOC family protein n=1 Tax=Streptomyces sp. NA04227 TaxID=2742136 RepID=UPI0015911130|nr:VOC family protein [Streptomyces sp. NA04227]QKW09267.1 VOC family protein [Streptomyces sp. NA04227]